MTIEAHAAEPLLGKMFRPIRMTPDEQREVGRRMIRARAKAKAARTEAARRRATAEAETERDKLIRMMMPAVVRLAYRQGVGRKWAIDDMVSEGVLCVLRGIETYDPDKGAAMTHLWHYARKGVTDWLRSRANIISTPAYLGTLENKIRRGEVAPSKLKAKVRSMLTDARRARAVQRGDAPLYEDDDPASRFGAVACEGEDVLGRIVGEESLARVRSAMSALTDREKTILAHRFGLTRKTSRPATLNQTGQIVGLTRERVRQIEIQAINKLRQLLAEDDE